MKLQQEGVSDGPGGRRPSLPFPQHDSEIYCRVIRATAPPMAAHAAVSLGLNLVVSIDTVTSVLV